MEIKKRALITGITGQDGSYLAEFLLKKGYEVHGIIRRSSSFNTGRISHIFQDLHEKNLIFHLHYGDLSDSSSIGDIIKKVNPDEVYNLGAQSHVRVSFDIPEDTADVTAIGTLRLLAAIHKFCPKAKFSQASSSEMFGKVVEIPQTEKTPFYPRSPYGISKVFSYWITKNYRESYGLFAANGILFNHECISENSSLIIRNKKTGIISIKRIRDIKRAREKGSNIQQLTLNNTEIWDGDNFVDLKLITATKRKKDNDDFHCRIINTRNGIIETTNHHNMLNENWEKIKNKNLKVGDKLLHKQFPSENVISRLSKEEALFMGMMVGDGYISKDGKAQFSNNDENIIKLFGNLWRKVGLGNISVKEYKTEYGKIKQVRLNGNSEYLRFIRNEIYTYDGFKKIADRILNANKEIKLAFLTGCNITGGLKSNPCIYEFRNFKTDSIILAQGLLFLISKTTMQDFNLTFEEDEKNYGYYSLNLLSPTSNSLKEEKVQELIGLGLSQRQISMESGISRNFIRKIEDGGHSQLIHHLSKQKEEIKKMLYHQQQPEWVYDIETGSGKFMAGVGRIVLANSPRRGETFVTKKITRALTRIKLGLQKEVYLGNLNSKRDWGYAPDFVEAMWLILQQDIPDDYVIATGETHSVREFIEESCKLLNINLEWIGEGLNEYGINKNNGEIIIKIDQRYYRPSEVDFLLGNYSKAREKLKWQPKITFKDLVKVMIEHDLRIAEEEAE